MYRNRKYRGGINAGKIMPKSSQVLSRISEDLATTSKNTAVDENAENAPPSNLAPSQPKQRRVETLEDDLEFSQEALIPASQPPTQGRYLSQRSNFGLGRTQSSKTSVQGIPNTYFEMVLTKAGIEIDNSDNYVLTSDHLNFLNRLRQVLTAHADYPENLNSFYSGFNVLLNEETSARKLFTVCCLRNITNDTLTTLQDSIVANFLMIDIIQMDILKLILEKLKICAQDYTFSDTEVSIFSLMISQLKFVTNIFRDFIYEKIIEIFEIGTDKAKDEIIANVVSIISTSKHDDFVEYLFKKSTTDAELLRPNTMETFCSLYLSTRIKMQLKRRILNYMKIGCGISLYPVFIRFLLIVANDETDIHGLICDLRNNLSWDESENSIEDVKSSQKLVFKCISQAVTMSKSIFDSWQKVLFTEDSEKNRPLDFMVLLMMTGIREEKISFLENIIRRRIKTGEITGVLLNEVKRNFSSILVEYVDMLLKMAANFLVIKQIAIQEFGRHSFRIAFELIECDRKKVLMKLVEFTCDRSDSNLTTLSLEILQDLQRKYPTEMQNFGMLLLPLLDRISDFDLKQYRMAMELMCWIAYPSSDMCANDVLQSQIDMLVRKQVVSGNLMYKKQGILGIVQLINRLVRTDKKSSENEHIYNLDCSYENSTSLPDGPRKDAAQLISLVQASTYSNPECLALFYDEMALVFAIKNRSDGEYFIDRHFMIWLSDWVTNDFQTYFLTEEAPQETFIELSLQHCINIQEDPNSSGGSGSDAFVTIAVNIAGHVINAVSDQAASSITILPAIMNLMCALHFIRSNTNLHAIDAILGCAIVLPKFFDTPEDADIFESYSSEQIKKILDIYFHTANWYREIISSFASQNDEMVIRNVLKRLSGLIELQQKILQLLKKAPCGYSAPDCHFVNCLGSPIFKKPVGRAKKVAPTASKKGKSSNHPPAESEGMSILATMRTQNPTQNHPAKGKISLDKIDADNFLQISPFLRQIDPDIMFILNSKLTLDYPLPNEEIGVSIGLSEFRFILSDLVDKLESGTGIKKFNQLQSSQCLNVEYFISDLVKFIPQILEFFKQCSNKLKSTIESVGNAMGHAALFTDEINMLKICFGLCLRIFADLFSWPGFDEEHNKELLKELLRNINGKSVDSTSSQDDVKHHAEIAFKSFIASQNIISDMKSAVHLYNCAKSLMKFCDDGGTQKELRELCKNLLYRKWHGFDSKLERGAYCNVLLDDLLKGFFQNMELKLLSETLKTISSETKWLRKKDDCLKVFPNIHKNNFPMLFRAICDALIKNVEDKIIHSTESIKGWEKSFKMLDLLLAVLKSLDIPRNFSLFVKYSHLFLKIFLQHGMEVFENLLRKNPERINDLLKSLQTTTRFLHSLCCHSKAMKNTGIIGQIPFLRQTIENLVFRVKAALAANNCSSVFWMGNLKNKDIHGDEILSQSSSVSQLENQDSDEEMPNDDDGIDETRNHDDQDSPHTSIATSSSSRASGGDRASSRSNCF